MPIYETFAKRKRNAEREGKPIVFQQTELPRPFRMQVGYILDDAIGDLDGATSQAVYESRLSKWHGIHDTLTREMGLRNLSSVRGDARTRCRDFLLEHPDIYDVLSLIELAFVNLESEVTIRRGTLSARAAIDELNHRFREHGIGYQFQGGQIISIESLYLHSEAVQPAISLLHELEFEGALQEFMSAHGHFREGNNKDAIVAAGNAFESTMKTICDLRSWDYSQKPATASNLLGILFDNNLIPNEMQSHFHALRSTLQSGLPTVRNREGQGGHGQGSGVVVVPDYLAAYCLHLAATNIVFLIKAHKSSN